MSIQRPLQKSVRKLPSNVDVGTITIIVNRDAVWLDATERLGEAEMEIYHRVASGISFAEQVYAWVHRYMPNARIVVSAEPNKENPTSPSYVGLSPDFPQEAEVIKRVMSMMNDLADNPHAWLVLTNGPDHVRIANRHSGRGQSVSKA